MLTSRRLPRKRWLLVAAAAVLVAAGAAYAAIPDASGVYTACRLNAAGTIRLIDPSGPNSSLLSHCTAIETQITWNQRGPKGDPGPAGTAGKDGAAGPAGADGKDGAPGKDGASPTVIGLLPGDPHCAAGGAVITGANGTPIYVCSGTNGKDGKDGAQGVPGKDGDDGKDGKDGAPFSGTFTSLNGLYSITVADGGVSITGPNSTSIKLGFGTISVQSGQSLSLQSGFNLSMKSAADTSLDAGQSFNAKAGATMTLQSSAPLKLSSDSLAQLGGAQLTRVGSGASCSPAARVGDSIVTLPGPPGAALSGLITGPGAATVCIG